MDQGSSLRTDRRLGREMAIVMILKLAALTLLWYLFFGPTHQVRVTPAKLAGKLFATLHITHRPRS